MLQQLVLQTATVVFVYMVLFYIIAQVVRDNSIVDIGWGPGFVVIAGFHLMVSGPPTPSQYLMFLVLLLWGLRLSTHIFMRNKGKGEDFRYAAWRQAWGRKAALIAFFKVFMLQGLVMLILSWPVILVFTSPATEPGAWEYLGLLVFLTGFIIESLADRQLTVFRKNEANRGRLITTGLWKYSRHPNYLGESILWLGIALISFPAPWGWTAILSPLLIYLLLSRISGVPLLEKKYEGRPEWEEYKRKTPPIFPRLF